MCSLKSLRGVISGLGFTVLIIRERYRAIKADTRSLDYGSWFACSQGKRT